MSADYTEKLVTSRTGYEGKLLTLKEDEVQLPDGRTAMREYVLHQGASMVVPLFEDFSLLFERQYRYPVGNHFLELPAGKVDRGESFYEKTLSFADDRALSVEAQVGPVRVPTVQFIVGDKRRFGEIDDVRSDMKVVFPVDCR